MNGGTAGAGYCGSRTAGAGTAGAFTARTTRAAWRLAALAAGTTLGGCALRSASHGAPVLASLAPETGDVGGGTVITVIVKGAGFDSLNTVHFGAVRLPAVRRTSDTTLQFSVPLDDTFLPGRGERAPQPLTAGRYDVRIETARGVSNAKVFVLGGGIAR